MKNDIQSIDWEAIDSLISHLPAAFSDQQIELHALSEQIIELRETHCTGTEHWRDANSNGLTPKLYVIHPTNKACPLHGSPEPGKRVRTYIGSKHGKIIEAREAIARGELYLSAMTKLRAQHQKLQRATHALRRIYWALGLELPELPADPTTEPVPAQ